MHMLMHIYAHTYICACTGAWTHAQAPVHRIAHRRASLRIAAHHRRRLQWSPAHALTHALRQADSRPRPHACMMQARGLLRSRKCIPMRTRICHTARKLMHMPMRMHIHACAHCEHAMLRASTSKTSSRCDGGARVSPARSRPRRWTTIS